MAACCRCLVALLTAISNFVPVLALDVKGPFPYQHGEGLKFATHLNSELPHAHPGAVSLLKEHGFDITELAWRISDAAPHVQSIGLPAMDSSELHAAMGMMHVAVQSAEPYIHTAASKTQQAWVQARATVPLPARPYGAAAPTSLLAASVLHNPSDAGFLVAMPSCVPQLPSLVLMRTGLLDDLKTQLLKSQKAMQITLCGAGGVGKTLLAACGLYERDVRCHFNQLAWLHVGKDPNIRQLHVRLLAQLTGKHINSGSDIQVLSRLFEAARGRNMLLVLDDVHNCESALALNCLDPDTESKILVTTRIAGLLPEALELPLEPLVVDQAVTLVSGIADVQDATEAYESVVQLCRVCQMLPLSLSIAGKISHPHLPHMSLSREEEHRNTLQSMKQLIEAITRASAKHRLRETQAEYQSSKHSQPFSPVACIITGALKSVCTEQNKGYIESVFMHFAIFPVGIAVPMVVAANVIAPVQRVVYSMVDSCLNALLSCGLLHGSTEEGVYMQNDVHAHAVRLYPAGTFSKAQQAAVTSLLAAKPNKDEPLRLYRTSSLQHHVYASLCNNDAPPDSWVSAPDPSVKLVIAAALGDRGALHFAEQKEAAGELKIAAHYIWLYHICINSHNNCAVMAHIDADAVYRCAELLATLTPDADLACQIASCLVSEIEVSNEDHNFEHQVLQLACHMDVGSHRHTAVQRRRQLLDEGDCQYVDADELSKFSDCVSDWMAINTSALAKINFFSCDEQYDVDAHQLKEFWREYRAGCFAISEAGSLTPTPRIRNWCVLAGYNSACTSCIASARHRSMFHLSEEYQSVLHSYGGVESLKTAITDYKHDVDCTLHDTSAFQCNYFLAGTFLPDLMLHYGELAMGRLWHNKVVEAYQQMGFSRSHDYSTHTHAIHAVWSVFTPMLIGLHMPEMAADLLAATGFLDVHCGAAFSAWSQAHSEQIQKTVGVDPGGSWPFATHKALLHLSIFLTGTMDDGSATHWWLAAATPSSMRDLDRTSFTNLLWGCMSSVTSLGAMAFERLERFADAEATARFGIEDSNKPGVVAECHRVLGRLAAGRGDHKEACKSFRAAIMNAQLVKLHLLVVIIACEMLSLVGNGNAHVSNECQTVMNEACSTMGKQRTELIMNLC